MVYQGLDGQRLGRRWAAVLVRARSHPPLEGPDLALVPIADLVRAARAISFWHVSDNFEELLLHKPGFQCPTPACLCQGGTIGTLRISCAMQRLQGVSRAALDS